MSGIGLPELIVVALVVTVLFGAPILTFFVGYVVGKNKAATSTDPAAEPAQAPLPESAHAASVSPDQPATPEEPADE